MTQIVDENGLAVWTCSVCLKTGKERRDMERSTSVSNRTVRSVERVQKTEKPSEAMSKLTTDNKTTNVSDVFDSEIKCAVV